MSNGHRRDAGRGSARSAVRQGCRERRSGEQLVRGCSQGPAGRVWPGRSPVPLLVVTVVTNDAARARPGPRDGKSAWLTHRCQRLERLLARAADDRRAFERAACHADAAATIAGARQAVPGRDPTGQSALCPAPQHQRAVELLDLAGVPRACRGWDAGAGPAERGSLGDVQADLAGEGLVPAVVIPALAAGVDDPAGECDAVSRLVEQGTEDVEGATLKALAADQDLGAVAAGDLPTAGGEVAELADGPAPVATGGDDEHGRRHVLVAVADRGPDRLQGGDQAAGLALGFPRDRRLWWAIRRGRGRLSGVAEAGA